MFKHEGHLKQKELTFLLGALSFSSLPSRLLLSLLFFHSITCFHYVLQLQHFFCFFFLCSNIATCIHSLHRLWYHLFKLVVLLLTFQAWHSCCLEYFCFIHCCYEAFFHFWSFGVFFFCFFIQPQHHHHFEDFVSLTTVPRLFCFLELFSFFVCNLFLQGSICFCFYNTFLWNCRFGQRPFMNNYLK